MQVDPKPFEEGIIGMILTDNGIFWKAQLHERFFQYPSYQKIFRAIQELLLRGSQANILSVQHHDESIDAYTLSRTTSFDPPLSHWRSYRDLVVKAYKQRELARVGEDLMKTADEPDEAVEHLQQELHEIMTEAWGTQIVGVEEAQLTTIAAIEQRFQAKDDPAIKTGYWGLDELIYGFLKRRFYLIGGRPSQGKTALLMNMAFHAALVEKRRVGIITLESSKEELLTRAYANFSGLTGKELQRGLRRLEAGKTTEEAFRDLMDTAGRINKAKLWFYDEPNATLTQIMVAARRMVNVYGVEIIFLDYLQLVQSEAADDRVDEVRRASMACKQIARQLNIPVVAAAQLRREVETRHKGRPRLSDFSDSSQIEKDADSAMLIHQWIDGGRRRTALHVDKNRDGELGTVPMVFVPHKVRFVEQMVTEGEPDAHESVYP